MKLSFAFIAFSVIAGVSAASIASTTASSMKVIMDDFNELAHLYAETVTALDNFPGSGSQGATNIHNNEVNIENLFQDVNDHIDHMVNLSKPVSQENAEKIINTYQSFVPTIIQSLNDIAAKSADFMKMDAATTMSNDVALAANLCANFAENILKITPASMMNDVNDMFTQLTAARQGASAALANVLSA